MKIKGKGSKFYNKAVKLVKKEKFAKALTVFQKAIDCYDEENERTISVLWRCYFDMGDTYRRLKSYELAIEKITKASSLCEIGGESLKDGREKCLSALGNIYIQREEFENAINVFLKSVELAKTLYSPEDRRVGDAYVMLGYAYHKTNQPAKEVEMYTNAMPILQKIYGNKNPQIASYYRDIANAQLLLGQTDDAQISLDKAVVIFNKSKRKFKRELGDSYIILAKIAFQQGNPKLAEKRFKQSIKMYKRIKEDNQIFLGNCYTEFGQMFVLMKKFNKAQKMYDTALTYFDAEEVYDAKYIRNIYALKIDAFIQDGKKAKARAVESRQKKWEKALAKLMKKEEKRLKKSL